VDESRSGPNAARFPLDRLVEIMDQLLSPGGCPWDQEQDHESLRPYVVEEAYEVVGAIDSGDPSRLKDELGDLLLQIVFHAALASREGLFDVGDVVESIADKMIRRHPHVFGDASPASQEAVLRQWEDIKRREAAAADDTGPRLEAHLPALMQAQKLLERAARLGREVLGPADEAPGRPDPPRTEKELGRRLILLLEAARESGLDAELSLRRACADLAFQLDGDGPAKGN